MSRFWAGFGMASLIWVGAAVYLHQVEGYGPPVAAVDGVPATAAEPEEPVVEETPARRRRRGNRRPGAGRGGEETPTGNAESGDDLREDEARTLDMEGSGGEQQLSGDQVEAAFDGGMGRIRRCFMLMPGDGPVTGRLSFGLRVASSGRVTAVRLSGPRAATTGEAGDCIRTAARGLQFDSFDGPEMLARYYIDLE